MQMTLTKGQAGTVKLADSTLLMSRILPESINNTYELFSEIFEQCERLGYRRIMLDMAEIRLLTSLAWGRIFAESEKDHIDAIVLFNTNEAMMTVARQMGIDSKGGVYKKISIIPDADISGYVQ